MKRTIILVFILIFSLSSCTGFESVEEYKNAVIKYAEVFKTPKPIPMTGELETLGDD